MDGWTLLWVSFNERGCSAQDSAKVYVNECCALPGPGKSAMENHKQWNENCCCRETCWLASPQGDVELKLPLYGLQLPAGPACQPPGLDLRAVSDIPVTRGLRLTGPAVRLLHVGTQTKRHRHRK